jgi:hypothetical protein
MNAQGKWLSVIVVLLLSMTATTPIALGQAQHVRWDIISVNFTTTPITVSAGGVAFAKSPAPDNLTIKLTGAGTFVALQAAPGVPLRRPAEELGRYSAPLRCPSRVAPIRSLSL